MLGLCICTVKFYHPDSDFQLVGERFVGEGEGWGSGQRREHIRLVLK